MSRRGPAKSISEIDELFALEYLANGENGKRAYLAVHPRASEKTAEVAASNLIRKSEVSAFIEKQRAERKARLIMKGDEALEGLTRHARGDITTIFKNNRLLPIDQWPADIADCVKAIKPTPFGTAITFYDKQKARELMAIADGKLRTNVDHNLKFDHAAYLGAEPPEGDDD